MYMCHTIQVNHIDYTQYFDQLFVCLIGDGATVGGEKHQYIAFSHSLQSDIGEYGLSDDQIPAESVMVFIK